MFAAMAVVCVAALMADGRSAEVPYQDAGPKLFRIEVAGKGGFIGVDGRIIIEPRFEFAWDFHEGLARASLDGKHYGWIDATGEFAIAPKFDHTIEDFSEGRAMVWQNGKHGFVNRKGVLVIPFSYDSADPFRNGVARVGRLTSLGRVQNFFMQDTGGECDCFYIDRSGTKIDERNIAKDVKSKGDLLLYFLYPAIRTGYGFANHVGKVVVKADYDYADSFADGRALVCRDDKWGFIGADGKVVIPLQYEWATSFSEGLAMVKLPARPPGVNAPIAPARTAIIDLHGHIVAEPPVETASEFSEGLAAVGVAGEDPKHRGWGYIDARGTMRIQPSFTHAANFHHGLARVEIDGNAGYVNKQGEYVWRPTK